MKKPIAGAGGEGWFGFGVSGTDESFGQWWREGLEVVGGRLEVGVEPDFPVGQGLEEAPTRRTDIEVSAERIGG